MSIELKEAAQQVVDAFDAFGDADDFASLFELTQKMRALRTAIQQAGVTDDGLISKDRFYGDDHVQDIAHALAQECEQAELDPNDLVTVNRAKLVAIAARVLEKARAILALRPERVPMTERDLELIDGMIAVQLDHAQRCDAMDNRVMGEKQKGWDMERVELLRRIRSFGITAQTKKETP